MAPAIPIITAIAGAAMSYQSYRTQKKAASTAEQIGKQNAANIEAETQEKVTRLKDNQRRVLAEARATGAATGFVGGSQDIYTSEMERIQQREVGWMQRAGKSQAGIAALEGIHAGQVGRAGAYGSLADAVGQAGKAVGGLTDFNWSSLKTTPASTGVGYESAYANDWWGR